MRILATLVLATSLALAGCMGSSSVDGYYLGVQGVKTGTESGTFENPGSQATVSMGVQGSGSVKVTIKDADGKTVFEETINAMGQSGSVKTTSSGKSGTWTVTLTFNQLSGQGGIAVNPK